MYILLYTNMDVHTVYEHMKSSISAVWLMLNVYAHAHEPIYFQIKGRFYLPDDKEVK